MFSFGLFQRFFLPKDTALLVELPFLSDFFFDFLTCFLIVSFDLMFRSIFSSSFPNFFDKKGTHDLTCLSPCDATGSAPDLLITTVTTEMIF